MTEWKPGKARTPPNPEFALWLDGRLGPILDDEQAAWEAFGRERGMSADQILMAPGLVHVYLSSPSDDLVECRLTGASASDAKASIQTSLSEHYSPRKVVLVAHMFVRDRFIEWGPERE